MTDFVSVSMQYLLDEVYKLDTIHNQTLYGPLDSRVVFEGG